MENKIVALLLVVAIVLSAASVAVSVTNTDSVDAPNQVQGGSSNVANIGLTVEPTPANTNGAS